VQVYQVLSSSWWWPLLLIRLYSNSNSNNSCYTATVGIVGITTFKPLLLQLLSLRFCSTFDIALVAVLIANVACITLGCRASLGCSLSCSSKFTHEDSEKDLAGRIFGVPLYFIEGAFQISLRYSRSYRWDPVPSITCLWLLLLSQLYSNGNNSCYSSSSCYSSNSWYYRLLGLCCCSISAFAFGQ